MPAKKRDKCIYNDKGFTLVELLITISILSIVSITIYSAFSAGLNVWKRRNQIGKLDISAKIALEKIVRDVRNIVKFPDIKITGDKNTLTIPTIIKGEDKDIGYYFQIGKVVYSFDSVNSKLYRKELDYPSSFQDTSSGGRDILSPIKDFSFKYYVYNPEAEEYSWQDAWEEKEAEKSTDTKAADTGGEGSTESDEEEKDKSEKIYGVKVEIVYKDSIDESKDVKIGRLIYISRGRML